MKIGIVGAGPAGLAAIRHCLQENFDCIAFEQTGQIGGTWNFVPDTGFDEHNVLIHSSMYQGLRTNIPKELMQFEDFPFKALSDNEHDSFISQEEVLQYIHRYAKHFNLVPHVKLRHQVVSVEPHENHTWTLHVKNLLNSKTKLYTFDAIIGCNGHYSDPKDYQNIPGSELFLQNGNLIHSHDFRTSDSYQDKIVLCIGAGPSGVDISRIISQVAKKTFLCYNADGEIVGCKPDTVIGKNSKLKYFETRHAVFEDGSREEIDKIIFCTGYKYSFPPGSGLQFDEEGWVRPLYKQMINIEHPTMCLINIPMFNCPFPMFGLQLRFFLALLKGNFTVGKEEMYQDMKKEKKEFDKTGKPAKHFHALGPWIQEVYFKDLADTAKIKPVPAVINKIFQHQIGNKTKRFKYRIANDEEFVATPVHGFCGGSSCG